MPDTHHLKVLADLAATVSNVHAQLPGGGSAAYDELLADARYALELAEAKLHAMHRLEARS